MDVKHDTNGRGGGGSGFEMQDARLFANKWSGHVGGFALHVWYFCYDVGHSCSSPPHAIAPARVAPWTATTHIVGTWLICCGTSTRFSKLAACCEAQRCLCRSSWQCGFCYRRRQQAHICVAARVGSARNRGCTEDSRGTQWCLHAGLLQGLDLESPMTLWSSPAGRIVTATATQLRHMCTVVDSLSSFRTC